MKIVSAKRITEIVALVCLKANFVLRADVRKALMRAYAAEKNITSRGALKAILENAAVAQKEKLAICQDTGMPVVFAQVGQDVRISGDLHAAIQKGVELGYRKGSLRNSIIADPLKRGKSSYKPAVVHTDIVRGNKIKLTVLPKGFGCENKSCLRMFKPTASWTEIKQFIIDAVKAAGPDACPPYVVGVGIGGTADYASLLAKKALLRPLHASKLERELLQSINALRVGPLGLGGNTTALAVHIETYPTHIAGLAVAVNISCHALRSASAVL